MKWLIVLLAAACLAAAPTTRPTSKPAKPDPITAAIQENRIVNGMTLDQVKKAMVSDKLILRGEDGELQFYLVHLRDGRFKKGERPISYSFTAEDGKVVAWKIQVHAVRSPPPPVERRQ